MYDNNNEYYTKGYINHNGWITSQNENVVGEFSIIGSSLRIEIYEGQTLSTTTWFYIADGNGSKIGEVHFTKNNDKLQIKYEQTTN